MKVKSKPKSKLRIMAMKVKPNQNKKNYIQGLRECHSAKVPVSVCNLKQESSLISDTVALLCLHYPVMFRWRSTNTCVLYSGRPFYRTQMRRDRTQLLCRFAPQGSTPFVCVSYEKVRGLF